MALRQTGSDQTAPNSVPLQAADGSGLVRAILGPTNTGKTFLAMDRMLAYPTGMIGFPLRLLARENYDKVVREKGVGAVALVTGEEKIIPPNPRWWICTVESMPLERNVEFLAIDEIQLCADPDRGHVFTDRLLHARGRSETMFMGSDTAAGLIRQLVPDVHIESRPRFSTLQHTGQTKLTRLPRRSAIVAFSVDEVYGIAELVRRQRGGTAVVLGALSPRTRNAQVAMYQAGEVDYLVATDAIGMGLNMDVNHVAFARLRKFDGHRLRMLDAPEVGQIAGRAGRHLNDGTFGVTNNQPPIDDEIVAAVEAHQYQPLTKLYWRNRKLDFRSPKALLKSLYHEPPHPQLVRVRDGEDQIALAALVRDEDVVDRAATRDKVHLLWDVCQIPDFRQVTPDHHAELLGQVFLKLTDGDGLLSNDWLDSQFSRLDRVDGDIDTITTRIAHIRTMAYIAHRGAWLRDAAGWQARAREIEDRLSDTLHERLIHRFVDKRASVLTRKDGDAKDLLAGVRQNGEVVVEGHVIGHIEGFRFIPHEAADAREAQVLMAAAERVLRDHAFGYVQDFETADDQTLALDTDRTVHWNGKPVGRLGKGPTPWQPTVAVYTGFVQDTGLQRRIEARVNGWLDRHIARRLGPLFKLREAGFSGSAKGLCFHLLEGLGSCRAGEAAQQIKHLSPQDRKELARHDVRFGTDSVFLNGLLKPGPLRTRTALWSAWAGKPAPLAATGKATSLPTDCDRSTGLSGEDWSMLGYRHAGPSALRVDRFERAMAEIRKRAREGGIKPDETLARTCDCSEAALPDLLRAVGCSPVKGEDGALFRIRNKKASAARGPKTQARKAAGKGQKKVKSQGQKPRKPAKLPDPNSPFAALQGLFASP
ncbi:helicase-related protein [Hwanghaeella sp.]|uniref:helicase-related protein n=1 Tax=Hwanghaeella sp. TaxID=2605943 RepID=UPI003CCBC410